MWSLNGDQSGQWRSFSITSHWPHHNVDDARDAHCEIQWVMTLLGTSIMTSQWVFTLLCVHIMASQCIMTLLWTFSIIHFLFYAYLWFYYGYYVTKTRTSSCLISLGWRTHSLFLCGVISLILRTYEISLHKHNSCVLPRLIKHSLALVIISYTCIICLELHVWYRYFFYTCITCLEHVYYTCISYTCNLYIKPRLEMPKYIEWQKQISTKRAHM